MRLLSLFMAGLLLSVFAGPVAGRANDDPSAAQQAETPRRYGLDPASPLEARVQETPAAIMKMFKGAGHKPVAHALTEGERRKLSAAFMALPPLHRRVLSERLRSVSFLDGMPNAALTSPVNPAEPFRLFDITIRAGILRQNVSEWLTEKDRSCFDTVGSPLSLSIEAGNRDALVFVLLHEATHIVDFSLSITPALRPDEQPAVAPPPTAFTEGVWSDRTLPAPPYRDPLRESVRYYIPGKTLPIAQAEAVYSSLRETPFASLYGSINWGDDLAEYVTISHWTEVLKQPYRIVIRKEGGEVFAYEPMKSDLVRSRIDQMKRFYEKQPGEKRPAVDFPAECPEL